MTFPNGTTYSDLNDYTVIQCVLLEYYLNLKFKFQLIQSVRSPKAGEES